MAEADYIARPDEPDTPSGLRAAFMAAKKLTFQIGDIARTWPRPPKGEETFPVNTLRMLEMVARVHFAAGVSLLYEDWLSYSADLHVRALAEIYAHVAWIRDKGGVTALMTPRGRAVCLELGMARALQTELAELSADTPLAAQATSVTAIGLEVTALQAAHASDNCTCDGRGRGYRTVRPTLAGMAKADPKVRARGAEWMYGYWKTASRVSHHSGFERMVKLHPSGARQVAPAEPWQRVGTFSALITAYGSVLEWTLELHPKANARALHEQLRSLLTDSAVQAAAAMRPQARPAPVAVRPPAPKPFVAVWTQQMLKLFSRENLWPAWFWLVVGVPFFILGQTGGWGSVFKSGAASVFICGATFAALGENLIDQGKEEFATWKKIRSGTLALHPISVFRLIGLGFLVWNMYVAVVSLKGSGSPWQQIVAFVLLALYLPIFRFVLTDFEPFVGRFGRIPSA